jgi:hypothetical protein
MALDYAQPGDVIVIDGAGYTDRALVGGMMLAYAEQRHLGGFVVNGAVRDLDDIERSYRQERARALSILRRLKVQRDLLKGGGRI